MALSKHPRWFEALLQYYPSMKWSDPEMVQTIFVRTANVRELPSLAEMMDLYDWMTGPNQAWGKSPTGKTLGIAWLKRAKGGASGSSDSEGDAFISAELEGDLKCAARDENGTECWNLVCSGNKEVFGELLTIAHSRNFMVRFWPDHPYRQCALRACLDHGLMIPDAITEQIDHDPRINVFGPESFREFGVDYPSGMDEVRRRAKAKEVADRIREEASENSVEMTHFNG